MDEAALVRAAASGDREAFRSLFERHRDRVFRIARNIVGSPEEARDVAQGVFLRLWEKLPSYRPEHPFEVWLHRMTVNLAIDAYRKRRRRGEEVLVEGSAGRPGLQDRAAGPHRAAAIHEVQSIFERLAERLPLRQRLAFTLREIEGLTSGEVAAILHTSSSTVRNQVLHARKVLQEAIRAEYPEYMPRPGGRRGDAANGGAPEGGAPEN